MQTRFLLALAIILTTMVPAAAESAPELITDRPDQTESSVTVPAGSFQLEVGWTLTRDDENGARFESHEAPGALLRIGLGERLELRLGWTGYVDEELSLAGSSVKRDGAGDGELGVKVHLRPESGSSPEIALLVGTSVPLGHDSLTSDRFDPSLRLLFSHGLGERLSFGYNLGLEFASERDGGELHTLSSYVYTAALGIGISDRLGAFVELFGDIPASASGEDAHSFDGGFTYLLRDNLQLDIAAGLGLSEAADDWFVGLGLSVRWPE